MLTLRKNRQWLYFLLIISAPVFSQLPAYSTQSQLLDIPVLIVNEGLRYEDVELSLDLESREFSILDLSPVAAETLDITLPFNTVQPLSNEAVISFTEVLSDSRCPSDVQCITAGEVTVILRFTGPDNVEYIFGLKLGDGADTSAREINGHYFRLLEVNPYPNTQVQPDEADYSVVVEYSGIPF